MESKNYLNLSYNFFNSIEPAVQLLKKTNMIKLVHVYPEWKEEFQRIIEQERDIYNRPIQCLFSDIATFITITPIVYRDPLIPPPIISIHSRKVIYTVDTLENIFSTSYGKWKITRAKRHKPKCIFTDNPLTLPHQAILVSNRVIPVADGLVYRGIPVHQYFSRLSGCIVTVV